MTCKDSNLLFQQDCPVIVHAYIHGCFVVVTECQSAELKKYGFSKAFIRIYRYCKKHDIAVIRFDADEDRVAGWPTFDW